MAYAVWSHVLAFCAKLGLAVFIYPSACVIDNIAMHNNHFKKNIKQKKNH